MYAYKCVHNVFFTLKVYFSTHFDLIVQFFHNMLLPQNQFNDFYQLPFSTTNSFKK